MTEERAPDLAAADTRDGPSARPGDGASARPRGLLWLVGIENALIPDMDVDELTWTGHRERWREDLALAAAVGATAVRYGLTWPEVETAPGQYDFARVDAVLDEMQRLGLEPVWDLVHFGVPAYLAGGYLDPAFPEAYAAYLEAFARRYRGVVTKLTPWNEPYISVYFRAGFGIWPPHLEGRDGFARLLAPVVTALHEGLRRLEDAAPDTQVWLNDGADTFHPRRPEVAEEAGFRTLQRYAAFDLLLGKAVPGQETHEWLLRAGFPREVLARCAAEPVRVDVIGLDYYPETEHDLDVGEDGRPVVTTARRPLGLAATALAYHRRYGLPLFVAESSAAGSDEVRRRWIEWNMGEIAAARSGGADVVGYTWWPLFDHVDWDSLLTRRAGFVCPAGLYHLRPTVSDRQETDAARAYRELATGEVAAGPGTARELAAGAPSEEEPA